MKVRPFFQRLALGALVGLIATIVYRLIQDLVATRAEIRQECWTWRWLPFNTVWLWPYVSMFLLVGLPWFFMREWKQVKRFAICLLAMALTGWITFLAYPTACVRPSADGQPRYYAILLIVDQSDNCMPCLHAAFSVLATWALATSSSFFRNLMGRLLLAVWLGVLSVSIVALRQHTDVDVLAGMVLGGVGAWGFTLGETSPATHTDISSCRAPGGGNVKKLQDCGECPIMR